MIIIKSLIVPAAAVSLGFAFGLHHIANGLPIQVVLILSTMPVGFTALVPPTLYNLDLDLANTNWLFSTASLIITVPILSFLITLF